MNLDSTFDVIVAGAGPAGCVLASRLSEDPARTVLLIEAGADVAAPGAEHPDVLDPFALVASNNTAFHWPGLVAEVGADLGEGVPRVTAPYLQGCGVGGASNINGMGADRGLPGDYDEWRDLGAVNWGWHDVLPYFKKLEHDLDLSGPTATATHGDSGPMPVRRLSRSRWAPFTAAIADAWQHRGFAFIEDYTADFRDGFSGAPTNGLPDRRVSAAMAYLTHEVRSRPNLKILSNARVDRLKLAGTRVDGVVIHVNGVTKAVHSREVIVSCGAIQSPALLMRSGIGPSQHLTNLDIDVVRNLPAVGANLQNHPCVSLAMYLPREAEQALDNPSFLQNWLRFSSNQPGCAQNDMHLMPFNKCDWHQLGARVGSIALSVLKPYSKGRIELASADPATAPKVHFNLMADARDYERLVNGLRFTLELLVDPAVAKMHRELFFPNDRLVASLTRRTGWNDFKARAIAAVLAPWPLRRVLLASSRINPKKLLKNEKVLRDFVRANTQLQFHVCGTCRMGRANDPNAVVDNVGRVHGIDALRVVDASIFPTIPRGYTHFIVLMAAEKIADAIRGQTAREGLSHPLGQRTATG